MNRKISTEDVVITGMFTAVLSALAQISLPTQPVPFTLSIFAVFLIGALLPPKHSFFAVLSYILLGAFGVPVFASFNGGIQYLLGITGGYIWSYPLMALIISTTIKHLPSLSKSRLRTVSTVLSMLASLILCYTVGTFWFRHLTKMSLKESLALCVIPYILFDCIKIILATYLSIVLKNTIPKVNEMN